MVVCVMQAGVLTRDAIKILNIYFSYSMNLMNQNITVKLLPIFMAFLKLCGMRNFSIQCKTVVFKTLALSELVYLALFTVILNHIIDEIAKI